MLEYTVLVLGLLISIFTLFAKKDGKRNLNSIENLLATIYILLFLVGILKSYNDHIVKLEDSKKIENLDQNVLKLDTSVMYHTQNVLNELEYLKDLSGDLRSINQKTKLYIDRRDRNLKDFNTLSSNLKERYSSEFNIKETIIEDGIVENINLEKKVKILEKSMASKDNEIIRLKSKIVERTSQLNCVLESVELSQMDSINCENTSRIKRLEASIQYIDEDIAKKKLENRNLQETREMVSSKIEQLSSEELLIKMRKYYRKREIEESLQSENHE